MKQKKRLLKNRCPSWLGNPIPSPYTRYHRKFLSENQLMEIAWSNQTPRRLANQFSIGYARVLEIIRRYGPQDVVYDFQTSYKDYPEDLPPLRIMASKKGSSSLTKEEVIYIYRSKKNCRKLALQFRVSHQSICNIRNGKTYKKITSTMDKKNDNKNS